MVTAYYFGPSGLIGIKAIEIGDSLIDRGLTDQGIGVRRMGTGDTVSL
jgi:hypothetical protein